MGNTIGEDQQLDGGRERSLGMEILAICTWL